MAFILMFYVQLVNFFNHSGVGKSVKGAYAG